MRFLKQCKFYFWSCGLQHHIFSIESHPNEVKMGKICTKFNLQPLSKVGVFCINFLKHTALNGISWRYFVADFIQIM